MSAIVLVGLPACGKSKLGRIAAKELAYPFIDLDKRIVEREDRSIAELFTESEQCFRAAETRALQECLSQRAVIATGGGVVETKANRELLEDSVVIYLAIDPHVAAGRAARKATRPLLREDPYGTMMQLATRRDPLYRSVCDAVVEVNEREPKANAADLVAAITRLIGEGK